jgi:hypothetical protein
MAWPTKIIGAILVALGLYAFLNGTPNPESGGVSKTALIPAVFGGVLMICGLLAHQEKLRKHVMHIAALVGVLGIFGGFMPIILTIAGGKELEITKPSILSGLLMTLLCLVFVVLCVKSFIDARKAREAKAASGAV